MKKNILEDRQKIYTEENYIPKMNRFQLVIAVTAYCKHRENSFTVLNVTKKMCFTLLNVSEII